MERFESDFKTVLLKTQIIKYGSNTDVVNLFILGEFATIYLKF